MRVLSILIAVCVLPTGCSEDKAGADTAKGGSIEAWTLWLAGSSIGSTPDGSYTAEPEEVLIARAHDPASSTFTESYATIDAEGTVSTGSGVFTVSGDEFWTCCFETDTGVLSVTGAFDAGEAWAWTEWHSTSTFTSGDSTGMFIVSTDALTDDRLVAQKSVIDADGETVWTIVETLDVVTEDAFDERMEAWGP